ncbi:MAG TPA: serine hydrolase [Saprospiraceae bacterium]|nr:serine hydrolase [Saprospiraceae bacterium]HNT19490.1 serine hydrolase [Saprospiraceae bacterium]
MKKFTAYSLLISMSSILIVFFFTLTSWSSVPSTSLPGNPVGKAEAVANPGHPVLDHLPLPVPEGVVKPLEALKDQELQDQLETILNSDRRWMELARNKSLSIGVVDMYDPMNSRFAAINGNHMMYAASLPKIAVLLASEEAIAQGTLQETPEVKQDMKWMIAKSSNEAASRMIQRVGIGQIARVLQHPSYKLYDKDNGGGLWVGKPYGGGGTRMGDPLKNLSHAASVEQVCKYYYKLAFGQLVNPERSRDMLQILVDPQLHHKFVSVLDRVAPKAKVYRKSGTWENWHADSALVWDDSRRYIVVALAMDSQGEKLLRDLMLKIDSALVANG